MIIFQTPQKTFRAPVENKTENFQVDMLRKRTLQRLPAPTPWQGRIVMEP